MTPEKRRVKVTYYTENFERGREYQTSEETFLQFIAVDGCVMALTETDEGRVSLSEFNMIQFIKNEAAQ